jgi:hypothetical protein
MFSNKKIKRTETVEEALARGVKIQREDSIMPKSMIYPDKYGWERRKRRSSKKAKKIDVKELIAKCTPEQKAKLLPHLRKQGVDV